MSVTSPVFRSGLNFPARSHPLLAAFYAVIFSISLRILQRHVGILLTGHALPEGIAQDLLLSAW